MPKSNIPYQIRIHNRLLKKIANSCSISQAADYIFSVTRSQPNLKEIIFDNAANINPLIKEKALLLENSTNAIKSKKQLEDKLNKQLLSRKNKEEKTARIEHLKSEYEKEKIKNNVIRWGLTIPVDERKICFDKIEIRQIIDLRKTKLSTYKARTFLECTLTEINRCDAEGLLPHAFKQKIQAGGKSVEGRFWLVEDLQSKKTYIEGWRESHNLKKSHKRKKQPLKVVV